MSAPPTERRAAGAGGAAARRLGDAQGLALLVRRQQHPGRPLVRRHRLRLHALRRLLALLVRAQLAVPDNDLLSADLYNQAFTLHGTVMMFLFAVPIFEAVAIFLLPRHARRPRPAVPAALGLRLLELPDRRRLRLRLDLLRRGALGRLVHVPAARHRRGASGIGADIWLLGLSFIEVASIAAAVELIVGIMKCRAPGMRINLMPLFAWYLLIVAGMILFAFPPLIAGDILFEMRADVRLAVLRPRARRRPAALAAPVLDLRPSRRSTSSSCPRSR